ncbi:hypothetical protein NHQ30_007852 [Ciborinia camelliae]|nr:hypothetical protein NHQ30_007852 [Ciborinia camelliae]
MSYQVNVYLRHVPSSEETPLEPATRIINLNPTHKVMQIGRASKSPNKGIQGATNNAWFDSPVMSRNHAEIIYRPSDNILQIRDVGSMHGTFLNGEKLTDGVKPLNRNDKIIFGAGVRRGMDLFPACHFDVAYDILPWKKPNSYTVPDTSDDELEYSDEDRSERESSYDTAIKMTRSSPAASKSIDAIDLTLDDTPSPRLQPTETSYISTFKNTENTENAKQQESASTFKPKSFVLNDMEFSRPLSENTENAKQQESASTFKPKSFVLNDMEFRRPLFVSMSHHSVMADHDSPTADVDSHMADIGTRNNQNDHPRKFTYEYDSVDPEEDDEEEDPLPSQYDSDTSDLEEDGCNLDDASDSDDSEGSEESEGSEGSDGGGGRILLGQTTIKLDEIPSSVISSPGFSPVPSVTTARPSFPDVREQDSDDELDDDNASVGLSEAADEGIQTLLKDGLLENKPADPIPTSPNLWSSRCASSPTYEPNFNYPASLTTLKVPNLTSRSLWSIAREASPSAVAMVKAHGSSNMAEPPASGDPYISWLEKKKAFAKALGDKTGKHDFFEAREDNKMQFQARVDEDASHEAERLSHEPISFTKSSQAIRFEQSRQPMPYPDWVNDRSISGSGPVDHTDSSPPYLVGSAEQQPLIHPFYFSSDASSRAPESPINERYPARSGLRIDDIIDGSSTTGRSCKRKADEISDDDIREFSDVNNDVRQNEVRDWASSIITPVNSTASPDAMPDVEYQFSRTINVAPPVLATTDIEARPIKRLKMKKFAEAVGYFALGGAAVGAGLFSALVATAPDFL